MLSEIKPDARYRFTNKSMTRRPEHSAKIMQIIALRSLIESAMKSVFFHYVEDSPYSHLDALKEIRFYDSLEKLVAAKAKTALNSEIILLFNAVIKSIKFTVDIRNDFAHGLWGFSDDLPNDILWYAAVSGWEFEAEKMERSRDKSLICRHMQFYKDDINQKSPNIPCYKIRVYSLDLLEHYVERFSKVFTFVPHLRKLKTPDGKEESEAIASLRAEPFIQAQITLPRNKKSSKTE